MPENQPTDIPRLVTESRLWARLVTNSKYAEILDSIRSISKLLAGAVSTVLPEFTDHSVRHMDALWQVVDSVLTPAETDTMNGGEAFLLGASFYVHDLGMASAVTEAGREKLINSVQYQTALRRFSKMNRGDESNAERLALATAARELHAKKAAELATEELPGLNRYLIEDSDFRARWGHMVAQIAESHHWPLEQVERSLGSRNAVPGPDGESIDLGYVACVLRIVDFAHMNRERALPLERLLRSKLPELSSKHWDAQASVTGPKRDGELLVFGSNKPIESIDAWWLFYDFASDLDTEIRAVYEYVHSRSVSENRFSLQGVKGVEKPSTFSRYIELPTNVLPIDIRVQPDSMERVVELLGGKRIYGADKIAPIRELLQNARDAIELRCALELATGYSPAPGNITVRLSTKAGRNVLSVYDNGVGMTKSVVRKHLLGVGSDFWHSAEFNRDFGTAIDQGFKPIGKFGIGFLSVFMLGEQIDIETERIGGTQLHLTLHGIGRRGELRETPSTGHHGTAIHVVLNPGYEKLSDHLPEIIRARAPMLRIPITVQIENESGSTTSQIEPGWWKNAAPDELFSFVSDWGSSLSGGAPDHEEGSWRHGHLFSFYRDSFNSSAVDFGGQWTVIGWPDRKPEFVDDGKRLFSLGGRRAPGVVVCSQGIAIRTVHTPDIMGLAEIGPTELTASRTEFSESHAEVPRSRRAQSRSPLVETFLNDLRPSVIARLDELEAFGMIPGRLEFIRGLATIFGHDILNITKLRWIPVTEPPGNLIHYSRDEFIKLLKKHSRLLLAIGVSPAGIYAAANAHVPTDELRQMLVVALRKEEVNISYEREKELEREHPNEVLTGSIDYLKVTAEGSWNLILTRYVIESIAEAWGTNADALLDQKWRLRFKNNLLWCDLRQ